MNDFWEEIARKQISRTSDLEHNIVYGMVNIKENKQCFRTKVFLRESTIDLYAKFIGDRKLFFLAIFDYRATLNDIHGST